MCLLLLAYRSHPRYSIVIAANRDEFHSRPASAAGFWNDEPYILAGKDIQAGGTWLGISRKGRLAAVTNYHEKALRDPALSSRGKLVTDFLRGEIPSRSYADVIMNNGLKYRGFNIIFGTVIDLLYCSNRKNGIETVRPGLHGMGNRLLNDDSSKVAKGKEALRGLLNEREDVSPDDLFSLLSNREEPQNSELISLTGTIEDERFYSPLFIVGKEYGTRCSTVILIDKKGNVFFSERSFSPEGGQKDSVHYEFLLTD